MGWTLALALILISATLLHVLFIKLPEATPEPLPGEQKIFDLRNSYLAVIAIPGLIALIFFSMFNNFIGGVYMALMDPYGLSIMSVEAWGITFGLASTGFILGGALIAKFGLGRNPIRTLLICVVFMGALGALFTIREWVWLYILGIWLYMALIPAVEAAEQTVIQKVVPYRRQGRVFGFAQMLEASAAPLTAFIIAPIAQYGIIPYLRSPEGEANFRWLLGQGDARGIALVFLAGGLTMVLVALVAMSTKQYRRLSATFMSTPPNTVS